ncbi:acyl-CoA dehydrogenase family protein [Bacillus thuringiensis]|nr:acyl-CoA dehydrogenase family protein [Bacillus cereus]
MMQTVVSKKQAEFRAEISGFVDKEIAPYAGRIDKEQKLDREIINKIADRGYLDSTIPLRYGGSELDNISIAILNEEMGRGCSSIRNLLTVHGMCSIGILKWGNEEQREKYLPDLAAGKKLGAFALTEPFVGSDAKSIEATAELEGDYYILNGRKKWITIAQIADVFLIFAKHKGQVTAFLLDRHTEGLTINPITNLLGSRGSMIGELVLENCKIPQNNIIGRVGGGLVHVALNCLDYGRFTVACGCVGLGQAALQASVEYAKERRQFSEPLKNNQLIQKMITEMAVNIQAARLICLNAAKLKDELDPDSIIETWNAKYFASTMLRKVTADAVQIHGGNGISPDHQVERYYRDSIINEIIEGSTQIHEMLIASHVFKTL